MTNENLISGVNNIPQHTWRLSGLVPHGNRHFKVDPASSSNLMRLLALFIRVDKHFTKLRSRTVIGLTSALFKNWFEKRLSSILPC